MFGRPGVVGALASAREVIAVELGPVEISRATPGDAQAILALQRLCYQSEAELYADYSIPPLLQTVDQLIDQFSSNVILKATDADSIIGSVRAHVSGRSCFIGRLIVDPSRQNRGIGRRLMAAIESEFPNAERFELFTGARSLKNLSLYAKLGYREFRRQADGGRVTLVYLEKPAEWAGSRTRG